MTELAVLVVAAMLGYIVGSIVERRRWEHQLHAIREAREADARYLHETESLHYLRGSGRAVR